MLAQGGRIKATRLSAEYDWQVFRTQTPTGFVALCAWDDARKRLRILSDDDLPPSVEPGSTVLYLSPVPPEQAGEKGAEY